MTKASQGIFGSTADNRNCSGKFNLDDLMTAVIAGGYGDRPTVPSPVQSTTHDVNELRITVPSNVMSSTVSQRFVVSMVSKSMVSKEPTPIVSQPLS